MRASGAQLTGTLAGRWRLRIRNYFLSHLHACILSLNQFTSVPLSSVMTAAVVGIALALPGTFHALLKNVQTVTGGWEADMAQISLFLRSGLNDEAAGKLASRVRAMPGVASVRYISSAQALEEFQRTSGISEVLSLLDENPLPAVLVVRPAATHAQPAAVAALLERVQSLQGVESARLDMEWVERLHAIVALAQRGVMILAVLLALAVMLIVFNTIRLMIENKRDEIVITKLVGATDAFIRRPFIYGGMWYGLLGGLIALILVDGSLWAMSEPVRHLSGLYRSNFELDFLDIQTTLMMLGASALLGLLGAWLAVGKHLRQIAPS